MGYLLKSLDFYIWYAMDIKYDIFISLSDVNNFSLKSFDTKSSRKYSIGIDYKYTLNFIRYTNID